MANIFDIIYGAGKGLIEGDGTGPWDYGAAVEGAMKGARGQIRNPMGLGYDQEQAAAAPAPQPGTEGPVIEASEDYEAELRSLRKQIAIAEAKADAAKKARQRQTDALMGTQTGFQEGGAAAFQAQQALAGLLGPEAQQAAIAQLEASPQFQALVGQGEQAILANAAATGGVRGGNTQAALAQFRPQVLSSLINQQYNQLMGMSGLGAQAGQGLIGSGISREQAAMEYQRWLQSQGMDLGVGAAQAGLQGTLGQLQYDVQQQQIAKDEQRAEQAADQAALGGVASGALQGAGMGAGIGALFGPPGALAGAALGGLGGAAMSALPLFGNDRGV